MLALVFINAAGDGGVRITSYGEQIERRELSGDGSLRWHVRGNHSPSPVAAVLAANEV
jgi:hypothetical protein